MTSILTLADISAYLPGILVVMFLFVCVVLILTILIQRPQGGGLVGAFGSGAGSGQTAFGAKTGDALTVATIAIFVLYLIVAVGLNYVVRPPSPTTTPTATSLPPSGAPAAPPAAAPGGAGQPAAPAAPPAPAKSEAPQTGAPQPIEPAPAQVPGTTPDNQPSSNPASSNPAPATPGMGH